MVGPVLADEAGAQRDYLYGRAMARVAAHELYHVVIGSRDHGHEGVAKPAFSVGDLLDERFDFDRIALALLRRKAGESEPAPMRAARRWSGLRHVSNRPLAGSGLNPNVTYTIFAKYGLVFCTAVWRTLPCSPKREWLAKCASTVAAQCAASLRSRAQKRTPLDI